MLSCGWINFLKQNLMKMRNSIMALGVLLLSGLSGYAQGTLREEFMRELHAKNAHVKTIVCDFVQYKHNSMLADDVQSSGRFRFKRPSMLSLIYDVPQGDRIVMGAVDFEIVAGGMKSVVKIESNPLYAQLQQIFAACFSGDISAFTNGNEFSCEETADGYVVHIVPESRRAKRYISEIVLGFSKEDMLLDELRIVEKTGNYTRYLFKERRTNLPVPDDVFDSSL